jgi:sugar phosphate isomerase/epimerase
MSSVRGARHHEPVEILRRGLRQMLDLCAGRIGAVHLIDSDGTLYNDETSRHTPFGEGEIDFSEIAPQLRSLPGVDGVTVDLCFCPERDRWLQPAREFVEKLLDPGGDGGKVPPPGARAASRGLAGVL